MSRNVKVVPVEVPANAPYLPPIVAQEQAWSIKALFAGKAGEAEQGMALRLILHTLCEIDAMSYRPDIRDDAFAQGKRFVGHQIARLASMEPGDIARLPKLSRGGGGEDDEMPTI